ncbi:hypothetical protein NDU88_000619 [Pleurodeles waltl]|uniref:Uncharacterized protein n=1 Tax=Pleurodeles waltl TaxID=8319 RepID=A0AAV7V825_PLEWA|nr:hypothetical protein NDU88_000619 [Pleurodeles waltl]
MQHRPGGRERCAQRPGTPAGHAAQTWRQGALCTGTRVTQRSPRGRERCAQVPAPGTPPGHTAQPWRQGELCTGTRVTRRRPGGRERCAQGPGTPAGHTAQAWRQGALCTGTRDTSRSRSADLEAGSAVHRDQGHQQVTQRRPGGRERCAQGPGTPAGHTAQAWSAVHRDQGHQHVTQHRPGGRKRCAQGPGSPAGHTAQPWRQGALSTGTSPKDTSRSRRAGLEAGSAVHRDQGHQQVTQRSPGGRERCPQVRAPRTPAGHAEQA